MIYRKICGSDVKEFSEADLTVTHFISSEFPDRGGDILYAAKNDRGAGMIGRDGPGADSEASVDQGLQV
jgi:hypothetical protein